MNFLAHFFLAFDNEDWLAGQFMGDYVKGKKYQLYPEAVQHGILLHRYIDFTTDNSELNNGLRDILRSDLSKYSGIAMDMYFDHFLAVNWNSFHKCPLEQYISWCYDSLTAKSTLMNEEMNTTLRYMIKYNWLARYQQLDGIERTLNEMSGRLPATNTLKKAAEIFSVHYLSIEKTFFTFFPQLIDGSKAKLDTFAAHD